MSWKARKALVLLAVIPVLCFSSAVFSSTVTELPLKLVQCIELALRNNRDIMVERMSVRQAHGEVVRAWSIFDPTVTAESGYSHSEQPAGSQLLGADVAEQETLNWNLGLQVLAPTGGLLRLEFQNERSETNSYFQQLNPQFSTGAVFSITQPLLKGAGTKANLYRVKLAKNNRRISEITLREVVLQTVANVENAYWNLVLAIENLRVNKLSKQLAEEMLRMTKAQVRTGALPPVATLQAEATAASREEGVLVADNAVQTSRRELLRVMNALNGKLASIQLVPKDRPAPVKKLPDFDAVRDDALQKNFQLRKLKYQLRSAVMSRRVARNSILPRIDIVGSVGMMGLAGNAGDPGAQVIQTGRVIPDPTGSSIGILETSTIASQANPFDGDYYDALDSMFSGNYMAWSVGLQFSYPLGNRSARRDYSRALLEERKSMLQRANARDLVKVFVENLIGDLETAVKRSEATAKSAELALKNMQAEEKKFKVGISTNRDVLEAQEAYAKALIAEVQALVDYNKSRGRIERARMGYLELGTPTTQAPATTSMGTQGGLPSTSTTGGISGTSGMGSTPTSGMGGSLVP